MNGLWFSRNYRNGFHDYLLLDQISSRLINASPIVQIDAHRRRLNRLTDRDLCLMALQRVHFGEPMMGGVRSVVVAPHHTLLSGRVLSARRLSCRIVMNTFGTLHCDTYLPTFPARRRLLRLLDRQGIKAAIDADAFTS
jgi:hypothetical protein